MGSDISFVYFDIGGVVILDFSGTDKWMKLKRELGVSAVRDKEFEAFWDKYEPEVNAGRDVETMLPLIKEKFGSKLPHGFSFLMDGFVNRFTVNRSIWPVIDEIHSGHKVGLLTNMYLHMYEAIKRRGLLPNVTWDVIIDSSVEGIIKPGPAIFKLAEQKAGAKGKQILFVDNTTVNVNAAKAFGWETFLYDPVKPEESSNKLLTLFKI